MAVTVKMKGETSIRLNGQWSSLQLSFGGST